MAELDELVTEFLVESGENLDRLDQDFVALEKDPTAIDRLAGIFRTIHTIKGTCGFLGFGKLESVAHVGESLLSKLRDGELAVTTAIVSALLKMVDALREILASIGGGTGEGDGDYTAVIATLTQLKDGSQAPTIAEVEAPPQITQEPVVAPAKVETPAAVAKAPEPAATPAPHTSEGGIRVDVGLLDKLMNLVGELVLARNQILQFSATIESATLTGSTQRLNLITSELQEGVMKTRMQPIDSVWTKFPRIVRDLSQTCGKKVRVEMEGRDTELDKTIIEAIKDPLTHIIRNSVDHGIEAPDKRLAAGKNAEGRLFLRAFHEGGQVNIEISDDGAGINVDRVKKKAIERGLITVEQAARMNEREATGLIFLPGFSTAEKITNVSGRGVGMDVVKTNIEKIGGTVDVQNRPSEGTTLRIRIPLTLAIIPALIITSGGDRFAIPQVSLLELVRLEKDQARKGIEKIHGTPVYRLRGNLLPLVDLNGALAIGSKRTDGTVNIVVLQADERQFGLIVDEINDTEEIVVKPLGKLFKSLTTFAGATIMGDGRVALILDVMGLAQKSNVVSENKDRPATDSGAGRSDDGVPKQTLLLFRISETRRMAIPLSLVARLEEFPRSAIEYSGDQPVIQYRGEVMPLINVAQALTSREPEVTGERVHVVVYSHGDRRVGLVVERVVDIVEEAIVVQRTSARPGVLGSAVIEKRVTELLDVDAVVRTALPEAA